jgi:transposase
MDRIIERGAGLDVHRASVTVCVRLPGPGGERLQHVRTFGTTTADLLALRDWLAAQGVTDLAMESTGVYWKPVYYVREEACTCLLVNAAHLTHVPGRKTDVLDCVWIAQVLEHGLLRGRFVPPPLIRDLRDLTRYRRVLTDERTREANRLHKLLQDAGIKLASVATDVLGVSGRAMLTALIAGTTDPAVLADLARGKLRRTRPALRQALAGRFRAHHAFLATQIFGPLDYLDEALERRTEELGARLAPFAPVIARLDTIPGGSRQTAEDLVAELGLDMTVFPSARHLSSWAGLCPGHHESAGQRRSGRPRKGNRWLRRTLVLAAHSARRTRGTALAARYQRIARHRGAKTALVAVAHPLLVTAYHVLKEDVPYRELGFDYHDRLAADRARRRAVALLQRQGYRATLEPAAVA